MFIEELASRVLNTIFLFSQLTQLEHTNRTTNIKLHYLNHHSNKEERKKEFKYYCDDCDFCYFTKALYKAHLEAKH